MFGGMKKGCRGDQAIEPYPGQLSGPNQHPPRFVTQRDGAGWQVFQTGQWLDASLAIVKEHELIGEQRHEGPRQALGVAAQPRAPVNSSGDVKIDGHYP